MTTSNWLLEENEERQSCFDDISLQVYDNGLVVKMMTNAALNEAKIPSKEVEETSQGAEVYAGNMMIWMIWMIVSMKLYPLTYYCVLPSIKVTL